ncbi:hypothetical protein HKX48_002704 [Thoreauomyces humboldtii]|nr:hypothetical protein HKX48_002704 [Thoreauomyces humboldtii]
MTSLTTTPPLPSETPVIEVMDRLDPTDLHQVSSILISLVPTYPLCFHAPLSLSKASSYFREAVSRADVRFLVARACSTDRTILGCVQLVLVQNENQTHRAEVSKLIVRPECHGTGVGTALMKGLEECAMREKREIVVLDTGTGKEAERFYERLGYVEVGAIPDYWRKVDGEGFCTRVFYKHLVPKRETAAGGLVTIR